MYGFSSEDSYERLGHAIIVQAVKDYRVALKRLKNTPSNTASTYTKDEVERFFLSDFYRMITNVDPQFIMSKIKEEVEYK